MLGYSPYLQRVLLYGHWLNVPFFNRSCKFVNLRELRLFGLQQHCRNVQVRTADGEALGGWHFAPTRFGPELAALAEDTRARERRMGELLADRDQVAVLFLHGQAGNRGLHNRLESCRSLASLLQAHVIMIDYRGFGDSTGSPSEDGLVKDAAAAWAWMGNERCAQAFVYGQSLGAAVAVKFCAALARQGGDAAQRLQGLVLDVPFASVASAMLHNPVACPFRLVPCIRRRLENALADKWESEVTIAAVECPILIFGGGRDKIVGAEGATRLYAAAKGARHRSLESSSSQSALPTSQRVWHRMLWEADHSNVWTFNEWLSAMGRFVIACGSGDVLEEPGYPAPQFNGWVCGIESLDPKISDDAMSGKDEELAGFLGAKTSTKDAGLLAP